MGQNHIFSFLLPSRDPVRQSLCCSTTPEVVGYQLLQNGTAAAAAAAAAHHENSFGKVENIDFRRELSGRNQKK